MPLGKLGLSLGLPLRYDDGLIDDGLIDDGNNLGEPEETLLGRTDGITLGTSDGHNDGLAATQISLF